ncbi:MAG: hypothetical protein JNM18_02255, partial [Planctomycetaceae bacterium]|nr:hypothetical protein [Planctomycetaceae bacterium]
MSATQLLGRLLGVRDLTSVERLELTFAAPWAQGSSFALLLACAALVALAMFFYLRAQPVRGRGARIVLIAARGLLLSLLLLFLAEPTIVAHLTTRPRPLVWLLFDGTDSMNIADDLPAADRTKLAQVADLPTNDATTGTPPPTRLEYLSAVVERRRDNVIAKLGEKFRLKAFQFDRPDAVRAL